jgi:hypothetical protein
MPNLEAIEPDNPGAFRRVALAVEPLGNREAWQVIQEWMRGHRGRFKGRWREISTAIWAERKKLQAELQHLRRIKQHRLALARAREHVANGA